MPERITSSRNPRIQRARRLLDSRRARLRDGLFVVEGEDLVAVALARGARPVDALLRADAGIDDGLRTGLAAVGTDVEPDVLDGLGSLGHGARVLAVFPLLALPAVPALPQLALFLDGVRDPGNVGTIVRGALAFGADAVLLGPGTADHLSPKAVRASMGALFAVPVAAADDPRAACPGARVVALAGDGEVELPAADLARPLCLVLGGEREGVSSARLASADAVARIPQAGEVGSLNVAMAATVALYAATTHRA